jgi:putative DNA primase/helicase
MIEGCLEWQRQGLNPPASVRAATDEYLSSEDTFENWRAENIEPAPHHWESSDELWRSWKNWAEHAGENAGTRKRFSQLLTERLFVPAVERTRAKRRGYYGGRLTKKECPGGAFYATNL